MRASLIPVVTNRRSGAEAWLEELNGQALRQLSDPELEVFSKRAPELKLVSSGPWTILGVLRLVLAVFGLPRELSEELPSLAAEKWSEELASQATALLDKLRAAREALIPQEPPTSLDAFTTVFNRWFTFLPSKAIKGDPYLQEQVATWRQITARCPGPAGSTARRTPRLSA